MQLSDRDIAYEIRTGGLDIDPAPSWASGQIQPASVELTLDWDTTGTSENILCLVPGEFRLARTREKVTLGSHLAAQLTGKSSYGRLGLAVHITAGYIDPGFSGHVVLELKNEHHEKPICLKRYDRIAQLIISRLSSPALRPYGHPELSSHYQGQVGTRRSYLED